MKKVLWEKWPEWESVKELGGGGFGVVYKAVRKDLGEEIFSAIKVVEVPQNRSYIAALREDGRSDKQIKEYIQNQVNMFTNEIKVMQSLKGIPNIVTIEDYYVTEKQDDIGYVIYIRMELLTPFKRYIDNHEITEKDVVKIGCDICSALELCHKKGIIHRDIKPENILVHTEAELFKLADFGVARRFDNTENSLTRGTGTGKFMSPEVASYKNYDIKADLYSLGLVLYYLANDKRLPFVPNKQLLTPDEYNSAIEKRLSGETLPMLTKVSGAIANVILKACAFDSKDRFSSATEMKEALTKAASAPSSVPLHTEPIYIPSQTKARVVGAFGKKKKTQKGVWTALILALLAIGIGGLVNNRGKDNNSISVHANNSSVASAYISDVISQIETNEFAEYVTEEIGYVTTTTTEDNRWHLLDVPDISETTESYMTSEAETMTSLPTEEVVGPESSGIETTEINSIDQSDASDMDEEDTSFRGGKTMQDATSVQFETSYSVDADESLGTVMQREEWFEINTTSNMSVYHFKLIGSERWHNTNISIYNDEYTVVQRGSATNEWIDVGVKLDPDSRYWIKITSNGNVSYKFVINEQLCDGGDTRENALTLELGKEYLKSIEVKGLADWFKFSSTENYSLYRFFIDVEPNESALDIATTISVFDDRGIKVEDFTIQPYDSTKKKDYFDLYLESNQEYYVKVMPYSENAYGDYKLSISELICDAGHTMETAYSIETETEYTAVMDSTFSDWYVCALDEGCRYKLTLHNIDTGYYLSAKGHIQNSDTYLFSSSVKNENSYTIEFSAPVENIIYIEFHPSGKKSDGQYIFILNKVEEN